jgi:hypothetical protein
MPTGAQRRFCLPAGLRGAERRCGSVSDPQRRAAGWVGATWRSFAPARATIPPPHSTHEDRLPQYDGGPAAERSEVSADYCMLSDQQNEKKDAPDADV